MDPIARTELSRQPPAQAAAASAQTGVARVLWPWLAGLVALVAAPWLVGGSWGLSLLSQMGCMAIICLSFNLLLGQGGMLSFGHAVFSGAGAFAAVHAMRWSAATSGIGLPLTVVPLAGGLAGLLLATVFGYVATRRAGLAFAMITLGLGELVVALAWMLPGWFGGEGGVTANRVYGSAPWGLTFGLAREVYYLIAAYALACAAALYALAATPFGRLLNAVRDNAKRVEFLGYDPRNVRWLAFALSGAVAGIGGALTAIQVETVTLGDSASVARSASILLFTYLGGIGFFWGPVLGAITLVLGTGLLSGYTQAWLLYVGVAFVAMVMVAPGGVAACVAQLAQAVRARHSAGWWMTRGLLGACTTAAIGAAVVLVETAYRWRFGDAQGLGTDGSGRLLLSAAALIALLLCSAAAITLHRRCLGAARETAQ